MTNASAAPSRHWIVCAAVAFAAYAVLAIRSQVYGEATLVDLSGSAAAAFAATLWLWLHHRGRGDDPPLAGVLVASALFHGVGVLGFPVLEDDYFRYLWDGYVFAERGSPYGLPPSEFFADDGVPSHFHAILDGINNPDLATIYGPTCEWIFRLAHAVAPGRVWPLQLAASLASFGAVWLLSAWVRPRDLLLFAWSPLVIKEFAFTAHTDAYALVALVAAFRWGRRAPIAAGLLTALSFAARPFAAIAIPFALGRSPRAWIAGAVGLVLLYAPFVPTLVSAEGNPYPAMLGGWLFNAPLHIALSGVPGGGFLIASAAAGFIAIWMRRVARHLASDDATPPRLDRLYGVFLLCVPAFNPWYATWPLLFATLRPTAWAWVGSAAVLIAYAHGLNLVDASLEPYEIPVWALLLEFGAIGVAVVASSLSERRLRHADRADSAC